MTENEKLRALLAEAREIPDEVFMWHGPKSYARTAAVLERINAALAEPVEDMEASASRGWQMADSLHLSVKEQRERAEKAERERDEARKYAEERNDEANKLQRYLNMAARERDEARAEVTRLVYAAGDTIASATIRTYSDGWRAGAESMREAAARVAEAHFVPGTVKQIRALPLPEDKP